MNWKTTLFGFLAALGAAAKNSTEPHVHAFGNVAEIFGLYLLGHNAADAPAQPKTTQINLPGLAVLALCGFAIGFSLTGCAVNRYTSADGTKLTQYIFLQKAAVDGLRVNPKTGLSIKSESAETQTEVVAALTQAAVQGAIAGAGKAVKP